MKNLKHLEERKVENKQFEYEILLNDMIYRPMSLLYLDIWRFFFRILLERASAAFSYAFRSFFDSLVLLSVSL